MRLRKKPMTRNEFIGTEKSLLPKKKGKHRKPHHAINI